MRGLNRLWVLVCLSNLGCRGCEETTSTDVPLSTIAEEVQFQSVLGLGSHQMTALIRRKDERGGEVTQENDETLVLVWQDQDSFLSRVIRDGRIQSEVRVVDGVPYSRRRDGSWIRRTDAEPSRVSVYTTWNVWDDALDLFSDRIAYSDPVADVYEGRDVRRYTVSLTEAEVTSPRAARRQRRDGQPVLLEGQVWIDGQTAVRLKAEITGTWRRGDLEKTVQFTLARTGVGEDQAVEVPEGSIETPRSVIRSRSSDGLEEGSNPTPLDADDGGG